MPSVQTSGSSPNSSQSAWLTPLGAPRLATTQVSSSGHWSRIVSLSILLSSTAVIAPRAVTEVYSHALLPQVTTKGRDDDYVMTAAAVVVFVIFSLILVCVGRLYPKPIALAIYFLIPTMPRFHPSSCLSIRNAPAMFSTTLAARVYH